MTTSIPFIWNRKFSSYYFSSINLYQIIYHLNRPLVWFLLQSYLSFFFFSCYADKTFHPSSAYLVFPFCFLYGKLIVSSIFIPHSLLPFHKSSASVTPITRSPVGSLVQNCISSSLPREPSRKEDYTKDINCQQKGGRCY